MPCALYEHRDMCTPTLAKAAPRVPRPNRPPGADGPTTKMPAKRSKPTADEDDSYEHERLAEGMMNQKQSTLSFAPSAKEAQDDDDDDDDSEDDELSMGFLTTTETKDKSRSKFSAIHGEKGKAASKGGGTAKVCSSCPRRSPRPGLTRALLATAQASTAPSDGFRAKHSAKSGVPPPPQPPKAKGSGDQLKQRTLAQLGVTGGTSTSAGGGKTPKGSSSKGGSSKGGGSKGGGSKPAPEDDEDEEGGDDMLQMLLDTKRKREQSDEQMRVRVDEEVEQMMDNGAAAQVNKRPRLATAKQHRYHPPEQPPGREGPGCSSDARAGP